MPALFSIILAPTWAAEVSTPTFLGLLSSSDADHLFAIRWQDPNGGTFQSWLRLGQRAGVFKLSTFDPKEQILSVEDASGRIYRLPLPDGKVRAVEELSDAEFSALLKLTLQGADVSRAPVLSREKARAFYLRLVRTIPEPPNVELDFDLDGGTLPLPMRATWAEDKIRARSKNRLLLAVRVDGKTELYEFPLHPFAVPEPMSRNLLESDWDEIGLLSATISLKRRLVPGGKR